MDLGRYSLEVLSAYGATGLLLAVITLATLLRARRVKRALEEAEARRHG